ncbi:MAG TPA: aminopeptidase [Ktedonobacterales bacterium]|jgi:aminopeptidase|nr:aminopeptidase [Ktedonobacterales bacterium]
MSAIPTFEAQLESYVTVLLRLGVNLQPGQNLVVTSTSAPVEEVAPVMRLVTRKAYEMGARNVYPQWDDAAIARTRMLMAPDEAMSDVQMWRVKWLEEQSEQGSAFLTLLAPDPDLFEGVDIERLTASRRANARASARFSAATSAMAHPWSVGAIATRAWARKVYPEMSESDALAALWRYIFKTTRIDQPDPLRAWQEHVAQLTTHTDELNRMRFKRLHYSAPGTDLSVDLPEGHVWIGGGANAYKGHAFIPNMPTEEVFSLPARNGVNGVVSSTMPLNYNGVMIDGIRLTLHEGRIVSYSAQRGEEALKSIIETDEGSHYLGEIALVPLDSPVNGGAPVYNTLFDENASCHIAIGRAYPICVTGGETMTPEELAARGVNSSDAHVDFMIGSAEMDIDGETASGERFPIFRKGMWAR